MKKKKVYFELSEKQHFLLNFFLFSVSSFFVAVK